MKKRSIYRKQKRNLASKTAYDSQKSFLVEIICDAVYIVRGRRVATKSEVIQCKAFLSSKKCERWLILLGINPEFFNDKLEIN